MDHQRRLHHREHRIENKFAGSSVIVRVLGARSFQFFSEIDHVHEGKSFKLLAASSQTRRAKIIIKNYSIHVHVEHIKDLPQIVWVKRNKGPEGVRQIKESLCGRECWPLSLHYQA